MSEIIVAEDEINWFQRNWVLCLALVLTVVWAIIATAMLKGSAPCMLDGRPVGLLECRTSNEIGDLLAGLFSPVAFVWLVAAVIMQSSELRAQRKELELTRKEYELTRSEVEAQRFAMQEQVIEARKNVALIEEQTKMLKRQGDLDEERRADHHVSLLIEIACESAYPFQSQVVYKHLDHAYSVGNIRPSADKAVDLRKYIEQLAKIATSAKELHGDNGQVQLVDSGQVQELSDALKNLQQTATRASAPVAAKIEQMRVRAGRIACSNLLKYSDFGDEEAMMEAIFNED